MFPEREALRTERPFHLGLMRFFGGDDFVQEHDGGFSTINPRAQNPCTKLEVATPQGTFRTDNVRYYGTHGVMNTGDVTEANFAVGLSVFEADDAENPGHWVLPLANCENVRNILKDSARKIRELDTAVSSPGQKSALNRIQGRAQSADGDDNRFGAAVAKLLRAFWLADAHILEQHYRYRPGGWARILSETRGDVTHHGYLPILEEGRDPKELIAVMHHLQDALARIIFKILDFDGGYNTRFLPGPGAYPVDWVKPHFKAEALGYEKQ